MIFCKVFILCVQFSSKLIRHGYRSFRKSKKKDHRVLLKKPSKSLTSLVLELIRPYNKWLLVIFLAMLLETAMSLLGPWPLKIIIDNVVGHHPLPEWLKWIKDLPFETDKMAIAGAAAIGLILIALIGGIAGYIDNYYTESVAQYVANDLRQKVYHHLQRLSLSYYDSHQIGNILSTITSDVSTIQGFASSALVEYSHRRSYHSRDARAHVLYELGFCAGGGSSYAIASFICGPF